MKTKTKTSKRIFSLFLAVLCILGVFFVSRIDSFAATHDFDIWVQSGFTVYLYKYINDAWSTIYSYSSPGRFLIPYSDLGNGSFRIVYYRSGYGWYNPTISDNGTSHTLPTVSSNPFILSNPLERIIITSYTGSATNTFTAGYFNITDIATPTPELTPTPTPAVTPDPGGSIPTPSGDYGSFFQRMAADAQSAFNALYLSWTNANNRFYSSIFFIGLPLLITVFGIVAGIILGDDD